MQEGRKIVLMKALQRLMRQQIGLLGMLGVLVIWQVMGWLKLLPKFILPTPLEIGQAFIRDAGFLASHSWATLKVALLGLVLGVILACILAILMDSMSWLNDLIYPMMVVVQTIPTIALAPILVLWLGYGILPKIVPYFYAGLRVSVSYAFITTVVSEWLGGFEGLGVYMIQSKKLFQYDTMFAIIILVSVISLLGMKLVAVSEKYVIKWK